MADNLADISKCIFWSENVSVVMELSLKLVPKGSIHKTAAYASNGLYYELSMNPAPDRRVVFDRFIAEFVSILFHSNNRLNTEAGVKLALGIARNKSLETILVSTRHRQVLTSYH